MNFAAVKLLTVQIWWVTSSKACVLEGQHAMPYEIFSRRQKSAVYSGFMKSLMSSVVVVNSSPHGLENVHYLLL